MSSGHGQRGLCQPQSGVVSISPYTIHLKLHLPDNVRLLLFGGKLVCNSERIPGVRGRGLMKWNRKGREEATIETVGEMGVHLVKQFRTRCFFQKAPVLDKYYQVVAHLEKTSWRWMRTRKLLKVIQCSLQSQAVFMCYLFLCKRKSSFQLRF